MSFRFCLDCVDKNLFVYRAFAQLYLLLTNEIFIAYRTIHTLSECTTNRHDIHSWSWIFANDRMRLEGKLKSVHCSYCRDLKCFTVRQTETESTRVSVSLELPRVET